jgi:hypothetical protein
METFMAFVFFSTLKKAGLNLAIFGREKVEKRVNRDFEKWRCHHRMSSDTRVKLKYMTYRPLA